MEEIFHEIENADGPLTVRELARRLDIEESALEGMLDFLARKGRLEVLRPAECGGAAKACEACVFGKACPDSKGGA